jgi:BirA family transcriptional regulator, biotin operon repressor / biotin---[acetyl-CoA-carboxylase] ligase
MKLDPGAAAVGVRLIAHDVLDSTNAEALRLVRQGECGPLWITAARQTAGRGRRGRTWISEPGNLYATLLLTAPGPTEHWPQLSFVAALAVHDAIVGLAAGIAPRLAIKWPNDILLAGGKVAGVLIEGEASGAVAVGIGVNCASHPVDTTQPAVDLSGFGVSPQTLLAALIVGMRNRLMQWDAGAGFSRIRAEWLDRAAGLGQEIRVRLADRELAGRFETIDRAGGLVLRSPGGDITIAAGDVILRAAVLPANAG